MVRHIDPSKGEISALRGSLERVFPGASVRQAEIRVLPADFSFRDLAVWKRLAREQILGHGGVISLDLDEVRNRLVMGVLAGTNRADVLEMVRTAGIPPEAVLVEADEPVASLSGGDIRNDTIRPVLAGTRIQHILDGGCTAGPTAFFGSTPALLINSHCSGGTGGVDLAFQGVGQPVWCDDGAPVFSAVPSFSAGDTRSVPATGADAGTQAQTPPPTCKIGDEIVDPVWTSGGPGCTTGKVCRESDAAIVALQPNVPFELGKIARTTGVGSLQIDVANPRWTITGETVMLVGQVAHKVGQTTGYSFGPVTNTCKDSDVDGTNRRVLCSWVFTASAGPGDSGSPVFRVIGGNGSVYLAGILWGFGEGSVWFSPLAGIRAELETPAQPLSFF